MTFPAKAQFRKVGDSGPGFDVMFNPASLKVSLTNKLQDEQSGGGGGGQARQNTQSTTTKLDTELVFDTTQDGSDVRDWSKKLKDLAKTGTGDHPNPPRVEFRWGRFSFTGVIESLNETLDFWSSEGVPLRSTVQLVMQGIGVDSVAAGAPAKAVLNKVPPGGRGVTGAATSAGNPGAGRSIAASNGIENMRMATGGAIAVGAGVELKAAAGFSLSAGAGAGAGFGIGASAGAGASAGFGAGASAGFGAGASAGFGAGASAGFGASASAGFGAGASAGFGASASAGFGAGASAGFGASASAGFGASASAGFGGSATAGVSVSEGAFAGLGVSKTVTLSTSLDPSRLLPQMPTPLVGSGAQFDVTGRVSSGGSAGLSANVRGAIRFG